jgi:hypothetical protein
MWAGVGGEGIEATISDICLTPLKRLKSTTTRGKKTLKTRERGGDKGGDKDKEKP